MKSSITTLIVFIIGLVIGFSGAIYIFDREHKKTHMIKDLQFQATDLQKLREEIEEANALREKINEAKKASSNED